MRVSNRDVYTRIKAHLIEIFLILLFLIAAYKVLRVELNF
jgi:hypothetical protein